MGIHNTAEVSQKAAIGKNTHIWHHAQVRENSKLGENCIIGKNVYIDHDINIGNNVKIQNNCSIYYMADIKDGVFIGPHCILTNDKNPRAIDLQGKLKTASDWKAQKTTVKKGASIGAGSIILPGISIGEYALIGAGSVVTKNVPNFALVYGNPAKHSGYVCKCAVKLSESKSIKGKKYLFCKTCKTEVKQ